MENFKAFFSKKKLKKGECFGVNSFQISVDMT